MYFNYPWLSVPQPIEGTKRSNGFFSRKEHLTSIDIHGG
jgi:hypothetical protein